MKFKIFIMIVIIFYSINSLFGVENTKNYLEVNVKSAIVIDNNTKRILFNHNCEERLPVASLTKIMTAILLIEHYNVDEVVTVPKGVNNVGGSSIGLKAGDKIKVKDLLIGMLLPSR